MDRMGLLMRPDLALRSIAIAAVLMAVAPPTAHAQHQHHAPGPGGARDDLSAAMGLTFEVGQVDILADEHAYQQVGIQADARWRRIGVSLHLPYYRIDLGPSWDGGLGDPHLRASHLILERAGLSLSGSFAVMAPLGDEDLGLGMGHWMFMAAADAELTRGRLGLAASFGYGGGLSSADHADHGAWPPVAPMNGSELEASAGARLGVLPPLDISAGLAAGLPLEDGATLVAVRAGLDLSLGPTRTGLTISRGLADHPLDLAVGLRSTVSF